MYAAVASRWYEVFDNIGGDSYLLSHPCVARYLMLCQSYSCIHMVYFRMKRMSWHHPACQWGQYIGGDSSQLSHPLTER